MKRANAIANMHVQSLATKQGDDAEYIASNKLPTCGICFSIYERDGERCPYVLQCGHSFCITCIKTIDINDGGLPGRCPIDKSLINSHRSIRSPDEHLPKNFAFIELLRSRHAVSKIVCSNTLMHSQLYSCCTHFSYIVAI
jgi:hypothetical protein